MTGSRRLPARLLLGRRSGIAAQRGASGRGGSAWSNDATAVGIATARREGTKATTP